MLRNALIIMISMMFVADNYAQFDLLNTVKNKVEEKVKEKTEEAVDEGFEKADNSDTEDSDVNETEENIEETAEVEAKESNPGLKSYTKFDFIAGTDLIYYDDFSADAIGDFPSKWNTNGTGEVVELNNYPDKWFKIQNAVTYVPYLGLEEFGENFTVEMEFLLSIPEKGNHGSLYLDFYNTADIDEVPQSSSGPHTPGVQFEMHPGDGSQTRFVSKGFYEENGYVKSTDVNSSSGRSFLTNKVNRISFAFNKQRFRVYLNEAKVMDLPRLIKPGVKINHMDIRTWYWNEDEEHSILIKDIRIARGIPDNRNQLLTEGKIVTWGILFDSGSDKIKPESYGTLKDIASILKDNADVKVKIVGHTDSDGDDASNLDLSKKRASAVKAVLSSEFGVDSGRIDTDGKGEGEPVSDNNSPEGKAKNRRVELIKI